MTESGASQAGAAGKYFGATERTIDCPECHEICGWCSWYRWLMRETGCGTMFQKRGKCKHGEAQKGTTCGTCDGSRKVRVRVEIVP